MKKSLILMCCVWIFIFVQLLPILSDGFAEENDRRSGYLNTEWQFGRADGSVIANKIRLLPGAKIEGYNHTNENHWGVEGGYLVFYHKNGKPSCCFTATQIQNGSRVLSGQSLFKQGVVYVLKEIRKH